MQPLAASASADAAAVRLAATAPDSPPAAKKGAKKLAKQRSKAVLRLLRPDVFMANERTFLRWTRQALALGTIGTALLTFLPRAYIWCGVLLWAFAVAFAVYAGIKFHRRARALRMQWPAAEAYGATRGPMAFMAVLIVALAAYVAVMTAR